MVKKAVSPAKKAASQAAMTASTGADASRQMRFFVHCKENATRDQLEAAAMLNHRLKSLEYQQGLYRSGALGYAFRNEMCNESYLMFKVQTLEQLDALIKADPGWPYSQTTVTPVTTTAAMVQEINQAVGTRLQTVDMFSAKDMQALDEDEEPLDEDGNYSLVAKKLKDVSALAPEETLNDLWARTLQSQLMHLDKIEFTDHNPVGQPVGLLIGRASIESLQAHVASAPIYPDTSVTYARLLTLKQAWAKTAEQLQLMRRPVPQSQFFKI